MLETLNQTITDQLGPLGPVLLIGFLGVMMILLVLPILLRKQKDPMDKLRESVKSQRSTGDDAKKLRSSKKSDKLEKYATFLEPQDEEELSASKLLLLQAGYRSNNAVRMYHFSQFALGILFLLLGLVYAIVQSSASGEDLQPQQMVTYILLPGVLGYYGPKYWVNRRVQARQEEITSGFPDSLDMMLVCVEAGQSLDQSILRVSTEIRAGYPALADEFEMVAHELKAGKDRVTVLRDMGERAGVPDVSSFVTVLIQSASFGTSISDALRVYAAEMRDKRVMRAEEKANTLPTKMTLATMMLTVPPLLIILIGPSIYEIYITLNGGG